MPPSHLASSVSLRECQGKNLEATVLNSSFSSVQFSHPVMSNSLWPHGLQYTRLPYPSLSPRVCSNSCPLSRRCHPTILSSVAPVSSCPQSFPASGSFPVSQLFSSGGQSIRASASASVLPMNTQGWFPLGLTDLISLLSKGFSRVFSSTTIQKHQFFCTKPSLQPSSHITLPDSYDFMAVHFYTNNIWAWSFWGDPGWRKANGHNNE